MRVVSIVALFALGLSGCGLNQQPITSMATQCEVPRPQVCTMEYAPVCANLVAGMTKEYSSGCNACADDAVASYLPGPCPQNRP
jgi:hypothetical protein